MKWLWTLLIVLPASAQTFPVNNLTAGSINGAYYPARCGDTNAPSWCSGTTADAWIRAACSQLPPGGGTVNLAGLTGNITAPATCSTTAKQVVMLADNTTDLTITESDGGIPFPQDAASMFVGPGVGQCLFGGGIHLSSAANVTAIVGPAHVDGTQEDFTATGLCLWGNTGATVTKGLIYGNRNFTNTTISQNNLLECNNACVWVQDVGGQANIQGNWMNVTAGASGITGAGLVITSAVGQSSSIDVGFNTIEHANGGANYPEINVTSTSGYSNVSIHIHDGYVERGSGSPYTPDVSAISISDCFSCSVSHVSGGGTSGGTNFISVSQTSAGLTANVEIDNIVAGAWTNLLNDTINSVTYPLATTSILDHYTVSPGFSGNPCNPLGAIPGVPYLGQCWTLTSNYRQFIDAPTGVQEYAWLSDIATSVQSVGSDLLGGLGNFSTGSSTYGTDFTNTGCLSGQGLTCTYTRTNSTAPPGSTYSQEVQITANTDPSAGFDGIQYTPTVSFTAGQPYIANFWAKGDGTFTGTPTFILWNSGSPPLYCLTEVASSLTTTWTLYSAICIPTSSGSSYVAIAADTPAGATGTFWLGDFIFSPVTPLSSGELLSSVTPYGIGPTTPGNSAAVNPLPTCNAGTNGNQRTVSDATSPTYMGAYTSGGNITAAVICSYNGSSYAWLTH
jgi:hypothetical protein